ncbi:MAG: PhzF family phenazine biosynthesis protein [Dokdonella sp.]|uniref:PhzF family phenazine biosynthesis protein n=1 Tax=Dokdonella sp. TaxID=2291710 RepID=UPI003262E6EC
MTRFPHYLQVDVFSHSAGGGNPLGVVVDPQGWSDGDMQTFAAWTGLVETTFVFAPSNPDASYLLRIFTPTREIPFAGHPTIGSAHAVLETQFAPLRDGGLVQECRAGLLPIRVEHDARIQQLFVQAPPARVIREGTDGEPLLKTLLNDIEPGALPPAFVEGGRRWWVTEFATEAALRAWAPDHATIAELARTTDCLGLCAFARAARTTDDDPGYDLVVRAFPAGVGIVEDPASGAANGLIAAWIGLREPNGPLARGYRVSQGREIGRDASIVIRIDGQHVWVGGRSHTIVRGTTEWPASDPMKKPRTSPPGV